MADSPLPASLLRRLIAETFGTYMLVFGVIGAALFFAPDNGALPVALAVGLAVLTAAYAVGSISGGHFNPAVTLGAATAGRSRWVDVIPYWIAQIVGGLLATLTLGLFGVLSDKSLDFGGASNGFDAHSPLGFGLWAVLVAEIVATMLFVLIILGVTAAGSTTSGFAPLAIGLSLTMFHLVMIPVSNASLNPARSIATAVLGGPDALAQLWVFLVAPLVGGLIAGAVYRPLFGGK
ncbi:aquaporin [Protaetiibacter mangrovi]|uniref:Aquaporin n=1 Tax=Protaetiibacter mangrovi TaxID=2970926 RepID=A0ABT1ZFE7_9MICO|nr:aquaporin [Protaetiibacter mangrovi]MCS0499441.1 aquaporin [Protaetiibacter mangrovi]TPX03012.1 aquaporin [Schumannella luteola]